ncbi:imelysin family protein [Mesorhizobium sp. DCY119]|uniref:imelysin family protein n=1 Tax=Mesorhizobium sp. DCY119 TaxID=2108445 RepID=UPI000E6D597F|nr:imelysin family protein [Mesorhizobium sp. DCY119]RJG43233.1 peptidase M75, Imelysin [Mesorhizobium sp. DCY119]
MFRVLVAAAFFVLGQSAAHAAELDAPKIVGKVIDGFVRPVYHGFHQATSQLSSDVKALCSAPSQAALDSARKAFGGTVDAWSKAEIIRFGPVTEQNRLDRILFWPDRKSTGLKQVQAAIQSKDETAADPAKLATKSVAVQGLGALEFVLFGTDADTLAGTDGAYRCSFGASIAINLDTMAGELEKAWDAPDGFAGTWAKPGANNPLYRNNDEAVSELFDVFVTGLEMDRDVRLGGFLGKMSAAEDKPKQAVFWRSEKTVDSVAGNLAGMKALFETSGLGDALSDEMRWIENSINFEFANAARAAAGSEGPLTEVLADPQRRGRLSYLSVVTSSLSELFGKRLAGELGLTSGFSSLDGD